MAEPVAQKAREIMFLMNRLNHRNISEEQLNRVLEVIVTVPGVLRVECNDFELTVECEEDVQLPKALWFAATNIYRRSQDGKVRTIKGHSQFRTDLPTVWDTLLQGVM